MNMARTFLEEYVDEIAASLSNDYSDNYDHLRFGGPPAARRGLSWKGIVHDVVRRSGYVPAHSQREAAFAPFRLIAPHADRFQWLYSHLADDESRRLLVRVLAYRALGHTRVKLPLSTPQYWQDMHRIDQFVDKLDYVQIAFQDRKLYRMSLDPLGFPIIIYHTVQGVYTQFVLQQYRCVFDGGAIEAEAGDCVIDGGTCWGDIALYFAHRVGDRGRVIGFEFIPSNLHILQENLELNPALRKNVTVVERALWNKSDLPIFYSDDGPGSSVSLEDRSGDCGRTETLTIDDLVERKSLPQVDFIKMDVEGAELAALQGAAETLKRFRPKLAISIYHRLSDFFVIPEFIFGLDLGYSFYIRHLTIHAEETVLFARAEKS